ncbi:MAG: hypothetical protein RIM99_16010 [Cyclobacteriaceae bacterium]
MEQHHDLEQLRRLYLQGYQEALERGNHKLPTYLEDWKETMNEIEFKFYSDIKSIGVMLYPYYPVEDIFVDFANPFVQVAVLIQYKKSNVETLNRKVEYLEEDGWTVYKIPSKAVSFSAEDLHKRTNPNSSSLDELEREDFINFMNDHSEQNSECLLYSIQEKHFN